jgi:3'-5' exonuclease
VGSHPGIGTNRHQEYSAAICHSRKYYPATLGQTPAVVQYDSRMSISKQLLWNQVCDEAGACPQSSGYQRAFVSRLFYYRLFMVRKQENIGAPLFPEQFLNQDGDRLIAETVHCFLHHRPSLFTPAEGDKFTCRDQSVFPAPVAKRVFPKLVVNKVECKNALSVLEEDMCYGFDCEFGIVNGEQVVRLIQLCGDKSRVPFVFKCSIQRPNELLDAGLADLLRDTKKPKITVGGDADLALLEARHGVVVGAVEDCQAIASAICRDVLGSSVSQLCQFSLNLLSAVCGFRSFVPKNLGELAGGEKKIPYMWNRRLSQILIEYAGFDALASLEIYEYLERVPVSVPSLGYMFADFKALADHTLACEVINLPPARKAEYFHWKSPSSICHPLLLTSPVVEEEECDDEDADEKEMCEEEIDWDN